MAAVDSAAVDLEADSAAAVETVTAAEEADLAAAVETVAAEEEINKKRLIFLTLPTFLK